MALNDKITLEMTEKQAVVLFALYDIGAAMVNAEVLSAMEKGANAGALITEYYTKAEKAEVKRVLDSITERLSKETLAALRLEIQKAPSMEDQNVS